MGTVEDGNRSGKRLNRNQIDRIGRAFSPDALRDLVDVADSALVTWPRHGGISPGSRGSRPVWGRRPGESRRVGGGRVEPGRPGRGVAPRGHLKGEDAGAGARTGAHCRRARGRRGLSGHRPAVVGPGLLRDDLHHRPGPSGPL